MEVGFRLPFHSVASQLAACDDVCQQSVTATATLDMTAAHPDADVCQYRLVVLFCPAAIF